MFVRSCGRGVHLAAAEEHAAAGEEEQTTLGWKLNFNILQVELGSLIR